MDKGSFNLNSSTTMIYTIPYILKGVTILKRKRKRKEKKYVGVVCTVA